MFDLDKLDEVIDGINSIDYAMCSNMDDCTCTVCSAVEMLEELRNMLQVKKVYGYLQNALDAIGEPIDSNMAQAIETIQYAQSFFTPFDEGEDNDGQ